MVTIDDERCAGCFACIDACPFGAVLTRDRKAVKNDLCDGTAELSCVFLASVVHWRVDTRPNKENPKVVTADPAALEMLPQAERDNMQTM